MALLAREQFGQMLRLARQANGHTLATLAAHLGVSISYLSQVERGRKPLPTEQRMRAMAEALDEDPDTWILLTGRVPEGILECLHTRPKLGEVIQEACHMTEVELSVFLAWREHARNHRSNG